MRHRLLRRAMPLPPPPSPSPAPRTPGVAGGRLFASLPPPPLPLQSPREVHVWYLLPDEFNDASQLKMYTELLSPSERKTALSMNGEKLQKGAVLSRALMRTTLSRYMDCKVDPRSFEFKKNKFGKPEILWRSDDSRVERPLHFNISHTSSLIACGITMDTPIKKLDLVGLRPTPRHYRKEEAISPRSRKPPNPRPTPYMVHVHPYRTTGENGRALGRVTHALEHGAGEGIFLVGNHASERSRTHDRWLPNRERSPTELSPVPGLSQIGIDVEDKKRKTAKNILSLARHYFTPSEIDYLSKIPDPDGQQKEFIKLWTLKEAYVKALGRGFSGAPFNKFSIILATNNRIQISVAPKVSNDSDSSCDCLSENWQFAVAELNSSHYMAICIEDDSTSSDSGNGRLPLGLKVWKTIPFVEDILVSGTEAVRLVS